MGFPLVVGAKSVASRPVALAEPIEEFADDGVSVLHPASPSQPIILVANSAARDTLAIITLSYYEMVSDNGDVEYCVAELRVQLCPASQIRMDYRETVHRVRLAKTGTRDLQEEDWANGTRATRMAVFSSDLRFLICLIPHPWSAGSTVVILQIRRAKETAREIQPPLPSYIPSGTGAARMSVLVATNPHVLRQPKTDSSGLNEPILIATSVASFGSSLVLLGTRDGKIMLASCRPPLLHGILYQCLGGDDNRSVAIVALDALVDARSAGEGRLAALIGNHTVVALRSYLAKALPVNNGGADSFSSSSRDELPVLRASDSWPAFVNSDDRTVTVRLVETHKILSDAPASCIQWLAESYVAVLVHSSNTCAVMVLGIYDDGRSAPVYTNSLSRSRLEENAMTEFALDTNDSTCRSSNGYHHGPKLVEADVSLLEYDVYSDCLAISSCFVNPSTHQRLPFVCLWNWKTNSQSFTSKAASYVNADSACTSRAHFTVDEKIRRKIVHIVACYSASHRSVRVRKDGYELALLSPPTEVCGRGGRISTENCLLLGASSVSYPRRIKVSARDNFEVQWSESIIPNAYIAALGTPTIAAIGKCNGGCIAVAASRGLCILDGLNSNRVYPGLSSYCHESCDHEHSSSPPYSLRQGFVLPQWHMIGNATYEKSFQVVAMAWWEGLGTRYKDDVLVAVVKGIEDVYYLSCWSSRSLEQSRQLLRLAEFATDSTSSSNSDRGIPLPPGFVPAHLDVLACPMSDASRSEASKLDCQRKACVLIADESHSSCFRVYQLQMVESASDGIATPDRCDIYARCSSAGAIGSQAQLFLAGSSFAFDLEEEHAADEIEQASVAVIGVIRTHGGGVDVISMHSSSVVAVGQVVEAVVNDFENVNNSEVSRLWLADVILDRVFTEGGLNVDFFVWVLQLASGRLVSWSVPFARQVESLPWLITPTKIFSSIEPELGIYAVHPKGISLGIIHPAGTTANWMSMSVGGSRDDFVAGQIPSANSSYVIGVAQSFKKLHILTDTDFERQLFRTDCFDHEVYNASGFFLYPSGSLPSTFSMLLDTAAGNLAGQNHFHRTIRCSMGTSQTAAVSSLQLMVIRLVEKSYVANKQQRRGSKRSLVSELLVNLVEAIRKSATTLQFSALFLKVGRQLEPNSLPHLFPLPTRNVGTGTRGEETMDDLFEVALDCGSMDMAVSALPLLADGDTTRSMFVVMFQFCLNLFDLSFGRESALEFVIARENRIALAGIFRYALKFHETTDKDQYDGDLVPERGYSIMCGVTNVFNRFDSKYLPTSKEDPVPVLVNGTIPDSRAAKQLGLWNAERLAAWSEYSTCEFDTVPCIVSRFILSSVFATNGHSQYIGWQKIGALGVLLMSGSRSEFQYCTQAYFSEIVQSTASSRYGALIPPDYRRIDGIAAFLEECINRCGEALDTNIAHSVLDLTLALLASQTADFLADLPGLLIVSIVAAHVSGRIAELFIHENGHSVLWDAYKTSQLL
jgi:hypothetical protein